MRRARVGIDGVELEPEQIAAELESMVPAIDQQVVVDLVAAILARDERRRVADRAELAGEGSLRIPHVPRIGCHALQTGRRGKVHAFVRAHLSAAHVQVTEPGLVEDVQRQRVRVAERETLAESRDRAAESRHQRFVERAGAERLLIVNPKRREPSEQRVVVSDALIDCVR